MICHTFDRKTMGISSSSSRDGYDLRVIIVDDKAFRRFLMGDLPNDFARPAWGSSRKWQLPKAVIDLGRRTHVALRLLMSSWTML